MRKLTVNPDDVKKEVYIEDITDKYKAEANKLKAEEDKLRKETLNLEREAAIKRLNAKSAAKSEKQQSILCRMMVLSDIMTKTYSSDSSLSNNRLFNEDELYPYKAKMLELLKQL